MAVKAGDTGDLILLERKLSVAISNPPKRKEQLQRFNTTSSSHQRGKIDLIPRTLARTTKLAKSTGDNKSNGNGLGMSTKNMSNEEFRSFLK
ncbi:hypothetical protein WUBG_07957 [Wuchereria bancrofti]|nr:hypothetical protein WUBG_07957 [Wuchereria bancrofti]